MTISSETLRIVDQLRRDIAGVTDRRAAEILQAYASAWNGVAAEVDAALLDLVNSAVNGRVTHRQVIQSARLREALDMVADSLTREARNAEVGITGDLHGIVTTAVNAETAIVASQLPTIARHLGFDRPDARQLDEIIRRTTQRIHAASLPIPDEQVAVMKDELVRAMASGRNPRATARRIMGRTEGTFTGGASRCERIARTEQLDACRNAQRAADLANTDVLTGWVWTCSLSKRTCPSCLSRHGAMHDLDEPGPLDHPNGRCARVTKTKSWSELGFDIDEPDDLLPDARAWFDDQTPEVQRDILGTRGYDAWSRGDWPMDQWSKRVETPEWRPSYVAATPPAA